MSIRQEPLGAAVLARRFFTRALSAAGLAAALSSVVAGCAPIVPLSPAQDAANPACAAVTVRLPDTLAGLAVRETNAQSTAAWGQPAYVIVRCGVKVPPPTASSLCVTVDGIDWLRDDSGDPNFVFTTYGRDPAVEVIIDSDGDPNNPDDGVSGESVLSGLSSAVSRIPAVRSCVTPENAPTG